MYCHGACVYNCSLASTFLQLFRIQSPQVPIVQNQAQKEYGIDEYPLGTNAVVAVISYTGFDMEDAMIVNKSSYERGFGHGSVYKVQVSTKMSVVLF